MDTDIVFPFVDNLYKNVTSKKKGFSLNGPFFIFKTNV